MQEVEQRRSSCRELRQIQIDGDAVAFANEALYLPNRSMGGASRPEAEARIREPRIEDRPQHLGDGLLDHPVGDRGDGPR